MSELVISSVEDEEELFERLCVEGLRNSNRNSDALKSVPKFYTKVRSPLLLDRVFVRLF